jgi:superfamily II DNA or RNA helicase
VPRLPDPNHPRVKDPVKQAQFMADLNHGIREYRTFSAMGATGSGKTACALRTVGELGVSTIVILHLERLLKQWKRECMDKLGLAESDIGIIKQDKCVYEGKAITLAMGPSLMSRPYDPTMYEYFGFKIVDEVHKFGSRMFAPVYPMFPARYALSLSATLDRTDGGEKVFFYHIGGIKVVSEAAAGDCDVYVVDYDCGHGFELWGTTPQARAQCLTRDARRNTLIVELIKRFHDRGRQALIVSDSIEHLQKLMDLSEAAGVPRDRMGQFTGEEQRVSYVYDEVKKRNVKVVKKVKRKDAELDFVKDHSHIIFATYGMMTEGIDIPRLDAGLDATPKGKATQLIGRIRRPMPDKKKSVWVTLRDVRCPISSRLFDARSKDYAASGAEVYFNGRAANTTQSQPRRSAGRAGEAQARSSSSASNSRTGTRRDR